MKRTTVALGAGLVLLAIAIGVTLSGSPVVIVHANSTLANGVLASTTSDAEVCQAGEALPGGASAIRPSLTAEVGPRVRVTALSGTRVLTSGVVGSGWTGGSVTIPVKPTVRTSSPARICFSLDRSRENVGLVGSPTSPALAATDSEGNPLPGRLKIEYLRASGSSWLSVAPEVARRMGLGHAPSGTWVALFVIALMGAVVATASWLVIRELR